MYFNQRTNRALYHATPGPTVFGSHKFGLINIIQVNNLNIISMPLVWFELRPQTKELYYLDTKYVWYIHKIKVREQKRQECQTFCCWFLMLMLLIKNTKSTHRYKKSFSFFCVISRLFIFIFDWHTPRRKQMQYSLLIIVLFGWLR